jgi:hypothetical protein
MGVVLYANYFLCVLNSAPPKQARGWNRARWAYGLISYPRGVGTSWQIRNIATFSRTSPSWVPPRRHFVFSRMFKFLCLYALSRLYRRCKRLIPFQHDDFAPYKVHFFRRIGDVTTHEIAVRLYFPANTFLPFYFGHGAMHCLISSIAVALGDSPAGWPPLYGDVRDGYSLRGFWGQAYQEYLPKCIEHLFLMSLPIGNSGMVFSINDLSQMSPF